VEKHFQTLDDLQGPTNFTHKSNSLELGLQEMLQTVLAQRHPVSN